MQLEEIIFEILAAGYVPLLAHPERYRYIKNPKEEHSTLKNLGVEFQVSINAFNGYYGTQAKKNALFLSAQGMIDFLGSDTHNMGQVENLVEVFNSHEYKEIYRYNAIKNETLI
jgi:tyrosine-protein phosphatase YwqE